MIHFYCLLNLLFCIFLMVSSNKTKQQREVTLLPDHFQVAEMTMEQVITTLPTNTIMSITKNQPTPSDDTNSPTYSVIHAHPAGPFRCLSMPASTRFSHAADTLSIQGMLERVSAKHFVCDGGEGCGSVLAIREEELTLVRKLFECNGVCIREL
jgi:hypothetical protein